MAQADFTYVVTVDRLIELTIREVRPKDFYWFTLIENDWPDMDPGSKLLFSLALLLEGEENLDLVPVSVLPPLMDWMTKELLHERVMTVQAWLETAFHLQKQRWDDSIDWLEEQPMSKVLLMTSIQSKFCEDQEREMKKNSRKR